MTVHDDFDDCFLFGATGSYLRHLPSVYKPGIGGRGCGSQYALSTMYNGFLRFTSVV